MPCIWGLHSGRQLFCALAIIPADAPGVLGMPYGSSFTGVLKGVRALIDTGATTTCITSRLARDLNLQPVGKVQVHGVSGVVAHNSYLFLVGFPFAVAPGTPLPPGHPPPGPGETTTQTHILDKIIEGCEFNGGDNPAFDVLLGMDVISTGSLVVQANGTFSFSF